MQHDFLVHVRRDGLGRDEELRSEHPTDEDEGDDDEDIRDQDDTVEHQHRDAGELEEDSMELPPALPQGHERVPEDGWIGFARSNDDVPAEKFPHIGSAQNLVLPEEQELREGRQVFVGFAQRKLTSVKKVRLSAVCQVVMHVQVLL
eukprot:766498-Hanusia_phi.AAC.2